MTDLKSGPEDRLQHASFCDPGDEPKILGPPLPPTFGPPVGWFRGAKLIGVIAQAPKAPNTRLNNSSPLKQPTKQQT